MRKCVSTYLPEPTAPSCYLALVPRQMATNPFYQLSIGIIGGKEYITSHHIKSNWNRSNQIIANHFQFILPYQFIISSISNQIISEKSFQPRKLRCLDLSMALFRCLTGDISAMIDVSCRLILKLLNYFRIIQVKSYATHASQIMNLSGDSSNVVFFVFEQCPSL